MSICGKEIGDRIRHCRQEKGCSAVKTAMDLNVSVDHFRKFEAGSRIPTVTTLADMVDYFQTSADYLLFGNQDSDTTIYEELDDLVAKANYIKKLIEMRRI